MLTLQEQHNHKLMVDLVILQQQQAAMAEEIRLLRTMGPAAAAGVVTQNHVRNGTTNNNEVRGEHFHLTHHLTREDMVTLVTSKPGRIEAALLKLESLQTSTEKMYGKTLVKNGRGFSRKHYTDDMKYMLSWIKSSKNRWVPAADGERGYNLRVSQLTNVYGKPYKNIALNIVLSYCKQLADVANEEQSCEWLKVRLG